MGRLRQRGLLGDGGGDGGCQWGGGGGRGEAGGGSGHRGTPSLPALVPCYVQGGDPVQVPQRATGAVAMVVAVMAGRDVVVVSYCSIEEAGDRHEQCFIEPVLKVGGFGGFCNTRAWGLNWIM